jgi:hypothetical protein
VPRREDDLLVAGVPTRAIEDALLREALRGASRIELGVAAQTVAAHIAPIEVQELLEKLEAEGAIAVRGRWWTTTPRGRRLLKP